MPISGQPYLSGQVHDLADLLGERLRQRAAEDREVLREDEDLATEDRPVAGDDGVAVGPVLHHVEVGIAVAHVAVELDERARVEQHLQPLAREQLPLLALALDRALAPLVRGLLAQALELFELLLGRVRAVVGRRHDRSVGHERLRSRQWSRSTARRSGRTATRSRASSSTSATARRRSRRAEAALGELEGGHALLFPSGAGATTALVLAVLEPGQHRGDRAGRVLRDDRDARAARTLGARARPLRPDRPAAGRRRPRLGRVALEPVPDAARSRCGRRAPGAGRRRRDGVDARLPQAARARRRLLAAQRDEVPRRPPRSSCSAPSSAAGRRTPSGCATSAAGSGSSPRPTRPGSCCAA